MDDKEKKKNKYAVDGYNHYHIFLFCQRVCNNLQDIIAFTLSRSLHLFLPLNSTVKP